MNLCSVTVLDEVVQSTSSELILNFTKFYLYIILYLCYRCSYLDRSFCQCLAHSIIDPPIDSRSNME